MGNTTWVKDSLSDEEIGVGSLWYGRSSGDVYVLATVNEDDSVGLINLNSGRVYREPVEVSDHHKIALDEWGEITCRGETDFVRVYKVNLTSEKQEFPEPEATEPEEEEIEDAGGVHPGSGSL